MGTRIVIGQRQIHYFVQEIIILIIKGTIIWTMTHHRFLILRIILLSKFRKITHKRENECMKE